MKKLNKKTILGIFLFVVVVTCVNWIIFANCLIGRQTNLIELGIQLVCCIFCSVATGWVFITFVKKGSNER